MSKDSAPARQVTPEQLARKAQQGDVACFEELVELFSGRLLRLMRSRGVPQHDAEDLVQDTFIRAYRFLDKYDPERPFKVWLFTIGTRLAASHWRKLARTRREIPARENTEPGPDTTLAMEEQVSNIWKVARETLSETHYDAMWYKYGEELSINEISQAMGKSVIHVKVMLHRARKKMIEVMQASPEWADVAATFGENDKQGKKNAVRT